MPTVGDLISRDFFPILSLSPEYLFHAFVNKANFLSDADKTYFVLKYSEFTGRLKQVLVKWEENPPNSPKVLSLLSDTNTVLADQDVLRSILTYHSLRIKQISDWFYLLHDETLRKHKETLSDKAEVNLLMRYEATPLAVAVGGEALNAYLGARTSPIYGATRDELNLFYDSISGGELAVVAYVVVHYSEFFALLNEFNLFNYILKGWAKAGATVKIPGKGLSYRKFTAASKDKLVPLIQEISDEFIPARFKVSPVLEAEKMVKKSSEVETGTDAASPTDSSGYVTADGGSTVGSTSPVTTQTQVTASDPPRVETAAFEEVLIEDITDEADLMGDELIIDEEPSDRPVAGAQTDAGTRGKETQALSTPAQTNVNTSADNQTERLKDSDSRIVTTSSTTPLITQSAGSGGDERDWDEWKKKKEYKAVPKVVLTADAKIEELFGYIEPTRVDLRASDLILRPYVLTPAGVAQFVADNALDAQIIKDVVYSIVMVALIKADILLTNTPAVEPTTPHPQGLISEQKIDYFKGLSKSMMIAAVHFYSQSSADDNLPWFESYCNVKGSFLSIRRFIEVCRSIISSGKLQKACSHITIHDLRSENNVLRYRLLRISSPSLVCRAINTMPFTEIIKHFDAPALEAYRLFDEAGVIAQVAAGPLKEFCVGSVNPLSGDMISGDYRIIDLAPIENPPYDAKTLRRAYIILEVVGYSFGKWYQGYKAMKAADVDDHRFKALVKAIYDEIIRQSSNIGITAEQLASATFKPPPKYIERVERLIAGWFTK